MSLENIRLSPLSIQNLYQQSLVLIQKDKKKAKATSPAIKHLGSNEKNITILIYNEEAAFLTDNELDFLSKILSACKLTLADVAIINVHKEKDLDHEKINNAFAPERLLLFGLEPIAIKLPFQIPNFQVQKHNSQVYITAPTLSILESDKELKKRLWVCFQQIFLS
jgi:hypothetical protein